VLIVDDDPDILDMMGLLLENAGYEVQTALDGARALDRLGDGVRPAIILLDLMMPVMDGWSFRDHQRRDPAIARIPVVVLTGDGHADDKARALGAEGYLRKPVELAELLAMVERYAGHP
jgi:CheY-like chemotaxis protein